MFLTCALFDVFEPVLVLLWPFSELVQGAKLAEDSFKTVLKLLNSSDNYFSTSSASEQVLEQVLGLPVLRQWKFWNGKQTLLPLVAGCHEMSVVVISDGPWRMLRVSWVLWSVVFFFFLLFYWKVCFPGMSISSSLAQWRVWTWQLCCCHLQDLFSCFCVWRRPLGSGSVACACPVPASLKQHFLLSSQSTLILANPVGCYPWTVSWTCSAEKW